MRHRNLAGLIFVLTAFVSFPAIAQQEMLRYVPDNAVGAVLVHPQRILNAPNMELMPVEIITAAGLKEFGFDPTKIESALMLLEMVDPSQPPGGGMVLKFTTPYDRQKLFADLLADSDDAEVAGVAYKRSRRPGQPAVAMIDAKTILVGTDATVRSMLQADDAAGPLRQIMSRATADNAASAYVTLEPVREIINQGLQEMPPLPPPLEAFKKAPELITHAELQVDLGEASRYELTFHTKSADEAGQLQTLAVQGLQFGKMMMLQNMRQEMGNNDDPVQQATMQYAERIMGYMFEQVEPKREGNRVVVSVDAKANTATIGIGVALLLPAVQAAREAARRMQSTNNLKQIGLAAHIHHDVHKQFPNNIEKDGQALLSWRVRLLPYIEEQELYDQFRLDEPWDSPHNKSLVDKMPGAFRNPNRPQDSNTNYLAILSKGSLFENNQTRKFFNITDGTSNTVMVVEADMDAAVPWTKPVDLQVDPDNPLQDLRKARPGIFLALFADGSVQNISTAIDNKVLQALFTISGGEFLLRGPRDGWLLNGR